MSIGTRKPTRWYYVLAILIPVLACGVTTMLVYRSVPKLPGALEALEIDTLTQVMIPGSAEIYFPKAGAYAVYYEYHSVLDGVRYVSDENPPSLNCQLKSKATGANVELAASNAEGNIYSTQNQERVGQMIKTMGIEDPGIYLFSCKYVHDRTYPDIVLAVGPNIIWEFLNVAAKPAAALVCGTVVFSGTLGVSILIIGIVAYKRHWSRAIRPVN